MKELTQQRIKDLLSRYPLLSVNEASISAAVESIITSYKKGGKILVCGNGGSASDALHIVGELQKNFAINRELTEECKAKLSKCQHAEYLMANLEMGIPAISLVSETSLMTAFANDTAPDLTFAQEVFGQGKAGDIFLGISTSGNSANVIYATEVAKVLDITTIGLTGKTGGKLKDFADILINVPETETYKIQELHLPIYHAICLAVEAEFFSGDKR